jgi:hypothetical protein
LESAVAEFFPGSFGQGQQTIPDFGVNGDDIHAFRRILPQIVEFGAHG